MCSTCRHSPTLINGTENGVRQAWAKQLCSNCLLDVNVKSHSKFLKNGKEGRLRLTDMHLNLIRVKHRDG